jgi:hypothetical protein
VLVSDGPEALLEAVKKFENAAQNGMRRIK